MWNITQGHIVLSRCFLMFFCSADITNAMIAFYWLLNEICGDALRCIIFWTLVHAWKPESHLKYLKSLNNNHSSEMSERGKQKALPSAINTYFKLHCTDFLSGCPSSSPGVIAHYSTSLHSTQCVKVPLLSGQGISYLTTCFHKSEAFRQSSRTLTKKIVCRSAV